MSHCSGSRRLAAGWLTLAAVAAGLSSIATPSAALPTIRAPRSAAPSVVGLGEPEFVPITWSDLFQNQFWIGEVPGTGSVPQLVIGHAFGYQFPDTGWGTYAGETGVRALDPTPPAAGAVREPVVGSTGTGTMNLDDSPGYLVQDPGSIDLTWVAADCASPGTTPCDRWYTRAAADGTAIGEPVLVTSDDRPVRGLPDGSFLTVDSAGSIGWRGPDGTDRGAPALTASGVADATTDIQGRLLLSTTDGTVIRWKSGGPSDLTLTASATGCADGSTVHLAPPFPYGGGTDSFATVCDPTATTNLTVVLHAVDGTTYWSHTASGAEADAQATTVTGAVVDTRQGDVWVAAVGDRAKGADAPRTVFVQLFTLDGAGPIQYQRNAPAPGPGTSVHEGSITDIRLQRDIADGEDSRGAFLTDDFGPGGSGVRAAGSVTPAYLAPVYALAPTCTVANLVGHRTSGLQGTVSFDRCAPQSDFYREPSQYCVVAPSVTCAQVAVPPAASYSIPVTLADADHVSTILVRAQNGAGGHPGREAHLDTAGPFFSVEDLVARQYHDLAGAVPAGEPAATAAAVRATTKPSDVVTSLLDVGLAHRDVEPVARLYRAFFHRDPDLGGLRHWVGRHRAGVRLATIAQSFARSSEFARHFGAGSNAAFVDLVYRNVFNRAPDPSGRAFWTKRLDSHKNSRGEVVLQFSESSEGIRRTADVVEPIATTFLMLGRLPTATERAAYLGQTGLHRTVGTAILLSTEYATRLA